jgi:hypothetical protein
VPVDPVLARLVVKYNPKETKGTPSELQALGRLSGRMLLERAKYQVATEALKKVSGQVAKNNNFCTCHAVEGPTWPCFSVDSGAHV